MYLYRHLYHHPRPVPYAISSINILQTWRLVVLEIISSIFKLYPLQDMNVTSEQGYMRRLL